jgi:hypothetical protein
MYICTYQSCANSQIKLFIGAVRVHLVVGMPSDTTFSLDQRNLVSDDKISTPTFFLYDDKAV